MGDEKDETQVPPPLDKDKEDAEKPKTISGLVDKPPPEGFDPDAEPEEVKHEPPADEALAEDDDEAE